MKFSGKVVLVTGASSGIGAATAVHLAGKGAFLSITGRNETNLLKVAEECKAAGCSNPLIVAADLTKESDVRMLIEKTVQRYGRLDVLVNNAGIFEVGTIETTSLDQFDRILNTNIRPVYQLTMLAVPYLIKSKGTVVNVSSVMGSKSFPGFLAYCVSKAALDQFTKCVALELAPKGVRVNSVNPAVIETQIFRRLGIDETTYRAFLTECKKTHALGRPGNPSEVAAAIEFLAGEDSSFITGELLHVDGGRHVMCPVEEINV
ncbi:hypothetical protein RUM43_000511 [Polyplax serrata]|uniref:Ketoreductase domain-containing protein n=1 Tax=Polyplax serrata TaxID=468196 RepID=A0AAN8XNP9_POLSC